MYVLLYKFHENFIFSNPNLKCDYKVTAARKIVQRERAANVESTRGSVKKSYASIKEFYDDLKKNPDETLTHKLKNGETSKLDAELITSKTKSKKKTWRYSSPCNFLQ